jgi:hypothetical protein
MALDRVIVIDINVSGEMRAWTYSYLKTLESLHISVIPIFLRCKFEIWSKISISCHGLALGVATVGRRTGFCSQPEHKGLR